MPRRNWKRVHARSLRHGMELCLEYARERQLSVDRVADLMGLSSKWTLYKWLENGRIPAILIPSFEHVTGAHFVTDFLTGTARKIPIDIPRGTKPKDMSVAQLQCSFADALTFLVEFYDDRAEAADVLESLSHLLSQVAWHRENVQRADQPELALGETSNE